MKPERELAETSIDNSYNPPVVNLYCGKCGGFVEEISLFDAIPYKDEILCAECQDELDELDKLSEQKDGLKDIMEKQEIKNCITNNRTLKIMVPGFSQSTLRFEVVDNKILEIRGKSSDFGTVSYDINIPENTENIKVNVLNGVITVKFIEKENTNISIIYDNDNEYEKEIAKIEDTIRKGIKLS